MPASAPAAPTNPWWTRSSPRTAARRAALIRFENLRAEQNVFGKKVAQAKGEEKQALLAEVKDLANVGQGRLRRGRRRAGRSRKSCSGSSPT